MSSGINILRTQIKRQGKTAIISGILQGIRKTIKNRTVKDKPDNRGQFAESMLNELHQGKEFADLLAELKISDKDLMFHINDGIDDGLKELKRETWESEHPKVGRNEPCPCGSGKKYKKCCI